jgi:hypothetical protein
MAQNELERVKADLEVMKSAVGMGHVYKAKDVYISLITGAFGLLLAGLSLIGLNLTVLKSLMKSLGEGLSLFLIIASLAAVAIIAGKTTNSRRASLHKWPKSYRWVYFIVILLFFEGYGVWENRFNLPRELLLGLTIMFVSALGAIEWYWRTRQPCEIILYVSLMILGALIPLYPSNLLTAVGLTLAAGYFVYAGVIAYVIRKQKVSNDAD